MKLGDYVSIRSGLVLSRKHAKEMPVHSYPLLTLRSIQPDGRIDLSKIESFDSAEFLQSEYLSQIGDVIVRLTEPYTAVLIEQDTADMVVTSNFLIIRTNPKWFLPEYLFWFLNSNEMRQKIAKNSSSNVLRAVNASYFSALECPLLPISSQKKLAELHLLARKEQQLLIRLATEKEVLYDRLLTQAFEREKEVVLR
ncbi:MAG: restriction endonuclease subunit S [Oscillibacter sp.]|nr:restriction endonuclease subunit S [Oscillibacter sp.]